jgi:site-specific recombinase XerD
MRPATFVFPGVEGGRRVDAPMSDKTVWHACRQAAQRAGITKPVHPHTLRHYAASRTMPRLARAPPFTGV